VFYDVHLLTKDALFHRCGISYFKCTSEVTAQMVKAADSEQILHRIPSVTGVTSGL
jgi:hypothetical protein